MRASVDITGAGPHTIASPGAQNRIMLREVYVTFAHNAAKSLRVWFLFGSINPAGPFYVSDGGSIRYRKTESPNTYNGGEGESFVIQMDPGLSCAGFVDYEVGSA